MLNLLAWFVFVPAMVWNILMWCIVFVQFIERQLVFTKRDAIDFLVSTVLMLVPGVYLFGW